MEPINISQSADATGTNSVMTVTSGLGFSSKDPLPLLQTIVVSLLLICIIICTISGNTTVLLAVYCDRRLRSTTNYFIVNLAAADLLLGITVLPLSASLEILHYWPFGPLLCDIWASFDVLWCTASIMTLCVISIDRYIGVTRPLQHSTIITKKRAGFIITLVWLLSIAISVGPLIGWRETNLNGLEECTVTKQVGYVIFSVSGSFYIPLLIIIVVYVRIYLEASRHSKFVDCGSKTIKNGEENGVILRIHTARTSLQTTSYSSGSERSEGSVRKFVSKVTPAGRLAKFKREKKAAKTLGIVVGVFIVCWFPFFFCLPLSVLCATCYVPDKLFTVIFWLGYCNSLMNPVIYASSSRDFKRAFIRVLQCYWVKKRFNSMDGTMCKLHIERRKSLSNLKFTSYQTDSYIFRRTSASPVKTLLVYQDQRQSPSTVTHLEMKKLSLRSSYSDIDESDYQQLDVELDKAIKGYSSIV